MPRFGLAALALAAVALLGACSSGKKFDPAASATTAALVTVPPTPAPRGSDDPVCNSLRTYNERFGGRVDPGFLDPQQLRGAMQEAQRALADAESRAPDTIRSDLALLGRALQQFVTSLEQANYDLSKLNLADIQGLSTPEFTTAGQNVTTYLSEHC